MNEYWNVYTDGGSRGNPGPSGCGVVIEKCTGNICEPILEHYFYIGETTNNQAEYNALITALSKVNELKITGPITFHLDSKLVVEQVLGNYKMKNEGLKPLLEEVRNLLATLKDYKFIYIPRERNKQADLLANKAMDEAKN